MAITSLCENGTGLKNGNNLKMFPLKKQSWSILDVFEKLSDRKKSMFAHCIIKAELCKIEWI